MPASWETIGTIPAPPQRCRDAPQASFVRLRDVHERAGLCTGAGIKVGIKLILIDLQIVSKALCLLPRRGGRAVECGGLENR